MKKFLSVMLFATILIFARNNFVSAATNNFVPLGDANSQVFYLMVQGNDVALNFKRKVNIVFTQLARNTKLDIPNQGLIAYNCAYGISGQSKPSGAIIFYENRNNQVERIKLQSFSSDTNFQVTGLVLLMTLPPIGLVDKIEVDLLLKNKEPVKNVWCKLKNHRIMMAEDNNTVLLFATEK